MYFINTNSLVLVFKTNITNNVIGITYFELPCTNYDATSIKKKLNEIKQKKKPNYF